METLCQMRQSNPGISVRTVQISPSFRYPVVFTRGLFAADNLVLADWITRSTEGRVCRCLCFVDAGLARAWPGLCDQVSAYVSGRSGHMTLAEPPVVLPGGETAKNSFEIPHKVIRLARHVHLCRQSVILAMGGGAFLDAVGFAAALVHRGVRLVRIPTTVLSQNDSGVGVKNGLNLGGVKNFLGTFAPPAAVFNDTAFLETLSDRDWIAGIAEAFKVGIVRDATLLDWIMGHEAALKRRDLSVMEQLIRRCAELHIEHIVTAGDPFEFGSARPLDFGHWAAHKLESLTLNELRHGEAVAVGMALDLLYAVGQGFIPPEAAERVILGMARIGLPVWHDALDLRAPSGRPFVFRGIQEFREHLGGELHITLPKPLGAKAEVSTLDEELLQDCIHRLRTFAFEKVSHGTAGT